MPLPDDARIPNDAPNPWGRTIEEVDDSTGIIISVETNNSGVEDVFSRSEPSSILCDIIRTTLKDYRPPTDLNEPDDVEELAEPVPEADPSEQLDSRLERRARFLGKRSQSADASQASSTEEPGEVMGKPKSKPFRQRHLR